MAGIVLAFAREDREAGDALGQALADAGYEVEASPPPSSRSWLARRAEQAQAVVVLWSRHAPASSALIRQAAQAKRAGKLVAVRLDASPRPAGLTRGVPPLDLRAPDGLDALLARLAAPPAPAKAAAAMPPAPIERPKGKAKPNVAAVEVAAPATSMPAKPQANATGWLIVAGAILVSAMLAAALLLR